MQWWLLVSAFNLDLRSNWSITKNKKKNKHSHRNRRNQTAFSVVSVDRLKTILKSGTIQNGEFFFPFSLPEILLLSKAVYVGCVWAWMAGKCDRNEYRIVWHPKGFPGLSPRSLWQPDAKFTLHLTSPYFHGEIAWIRNSSIGGFRLSVFIFPTRKKKTKWKGMEKEEEIVWKTLQASKEMFDIDLDCEGGVQSQMCAFVIKQVWIFHLRQKARFFFPSARHYVLLLFSC